MPVAVILAALLSAEPAALHSTGGLFRDPADVPWLVESKPDATALDPPPAIDHSPDMPPVGSQGSLPSCTSWAFAYYYKTYQEWLERGWDVTDPAHQFSPTFLYNMANAGGNIGSYYTDNMKLMLDFGCATLADCPNSSSPVSWPSETAYARAQPFRCEAAGYIDCGSDPGIVVLKQHIADGDNAVLPINVWANFDNINNFDTCYCSVDRYGSNRGGHYVTLVGYDDARPTNDGPGAFRMVNSWGTGWGNRGYGWMSYAAVKDAQLSYRLGLYLEDRVGYTPQLVVRVRLTHGAREDVRLDGAVCREGAPVWSKSFLDRDLQRLGVHAFPDHPLPLDLTDGADSLDPADTTGILVACRDVRLDGVTGELTGAAGVDLLRGSYGTAGAVSVPVPDDGTAAGAGFALPGQRLHWPGFQRFPGHCGATGLRAELDTLRPAGAVMTGGPLSAAPVMGDLDGDGRNEVVFGSGDGVLRVVNGERAAVAWSDSLGCAMVDAPGIGDLDGDGWLDVVAADADGRVRAWDGPSGAPSWTYEAGVPLSGGVTIGDPDVDGGLEVVIATTGGTVTALDGTTGSVEWSVTLPGAAVGAPALGDADGDGRLEVVVGVTDSCYRSLDGTTGSADGASSLAIAAACAPALVDLDGSAGPELVIVTADGQVRAYAAGSDSLLWAFPGNARTPPAVGDIDGDGSPEVVFGAGDSTVRALGADGQPRWTVAAAGAVSSAPALGRVGADSGLDVVTGTAGGVLLVLDGGTGAAIVTRPLGGAAGSEPALGDFDGDGRLDVAVGSFDGGLYLFGGAAAGVAEESPVPDATRPTLAAGPNPFGSRVAIRYTLAQDGPVSLSVHDIAGRVVRQLHASGAKRGTYSVGWDGTNGRGRMLAEGVYFCRLVVPGLGHDPDSGGGIGSCPAPLTLKLVLQR
ncbi:PQQ-binding-like beta-propeller repeat protein [candidate division WOR-3 bacterium]|nr:PQQ-binding-like beta-propeller repeat protein [candidate division WOR-3 bacterium]